MVGFWSDNGREFRNSNMEEFVNKLRVKFKFTPAYLPWSNGVYERNHYSIEVINKKVMEQDLKLVIQEAVTMAAWCNAVRDLWALEDLKEGLGPLDLSEPHCL